MRLIRPAAILSVLTFTSLGPVACGDDDGAAPGPAGGSAGAAAGTKGGNAGAAGSSAKGGTGGAAGTNAKGGSSGSSGTAGAGGSGGTGGTAGKSGSSGSSGTGGSAGAAGKGGAAGGSGSSGTGGAAGKGGSAGTAGAAGKGGSAGSGTVDPKSFVCETLPVGTALKADDLERFADGMCARPAECCAFKDAAYCKDYYKKIYTAYEAKRLPDADACLTALEAAKGTCDTPKICEKAFTIVAVGTAKPGEACGAGVICQPCANAGISCNSQSDGVSTKKTCVARIPAQKGEVCDSFSAKADVLRDCVDGLRCETDGADPQGVCVDDTAPSTQQCLATPPLDASPSYDDLNTAICDSFADCCVAAGEQPGGARCVAAAGVFGLLGYQGHYDAARAAQCIAETKGTKAKCDRFGFSFSFGGGLPDEDAPSNICKRVFEPPTAAPPGGACKQASDCQLPDVGTVACVNEICIARVPGNEGAACITTTSGTGLPTSSAICQPKDGLFCDATAKVCAKLREVGGDCDRPGACKSGVCTEKKCAAVTAIGGACTVDATCGDAASCEGGTCKAKLAKGAACTRNASCDTGECVNGKCDLDLGLGAFYCR